MEAQREARSNQGPLRAKSVALVARELTSGHDDAFDLDGASLRVERGHLVAVVGKPEPSAALFNVLAGFAGGTRDDAGSVHIGVQDIGSLSPRALTLFRRRNIGLVFPRPNLIPSLGVRENALFTARVAGIDVPNDYLEALLALGGVANATTAKLTRAQAQIVACARAMALRAPVVIARNPLEGLDPAEANDVMGFLRESAHRFNQGILVLSPRSDQVRQSDHTVYLDEGKIVTAVITDAPSAYTQPSTCTDTHKDAANAHGQLAEASSIFHAEDMAQRLPLRDVLEELAPARPFTDEQQRLVSHAQEILQSLPGPIVDAELGAVANVPAVSPTPRPRAVSAPGASIYERLEDKENVNVEWNDPTAFEEHK